MYMNNVCEFLIQSRTLRVSYTVYIIQYIIAIRMYNAID